LIAGMLDRRSEAEAAVHARREVVLLRHRRRRARGADPLLSALWATVAAGVGFILIVAVDLAVWQQAGWYWPLAASTS